MILNYISDNETVQLWFVIMLIGLLGVYLICRAFVVCSENDFKNNENARSHQAMQNYNQRILQERLHNTPPAKPKTRRTK